MPRYLIEALTAAGPFSGERQGLGKSRLVDIIDAPSSEAAVAQATRSGCSVLDLVQGIRFRVTPINHAASSEVWAQYERPEGDGHERSMNYGEVTVTRA